MLAVEVPVMTEPEAFVLMKPEAPETEEKLRGCLEDSPAPVTVVTEPAMMNAGTLVAVALEVRLQEEYPSMK